MRTSGKDAVFVYPDRAGVVSLEGGLQFTARIPLGQDAELLLYRPGEEEPFRIQTLPSGHFVGELVSVRLEGLGGEALEYLYRSGGHTWTDPCAGELSVSGRGLVRERRAYEGPRPSLSLSDLVVYKAHVRGLTASRTSGVRSKGSFAGVKEKIPYLRKLGFNALLLQPVYEFRDRVGGESSYDLSGGIRVRRLEEGEPKKNYWGYAGGFYFAPRRDYALSDSPCEEFLELVEALHRENMVCLLEFWFGDQTGFQLASDVLHHWQRWYGVDGFRVLGGRDWARDLASDPLLGRSLLILSDPSSASRGAGSRHLICYDRQYRDRMRCFLKGDMGIEIGDICRLLRRNEESFSYLNYFSDQDGLTLHDMVTYEEKHNEANGEGNRDGEDCNLTWNCGVEGETRRQQVRQLRRKMLRNALTFLSLSQGIPMLQAGDEQGNSQAGNNNCWCQDNELGWVTWSRSAADRDLADFLAELLRFRSDFPILHTERPLRQEDYRGYGLPDLSYHSHAAWMIDEVTTPNGIGLLYNSRYAGEEDVKIYMVCNMYWKRQTFAVPRLPAGEVWRRKIDTADSEMPVCPRGQEPVFDRIGDQRVEVEERSILVLISDRSPETKRGKRELK